MERVTLIVPWLKSISPHFKPDNSLCRNPVVAARSTSVRSRIAKPLTNALISAGVRIIGPARRCPRAESGYRLRNSPITTANDGLAMML